MRASGESPADAPRATLRAKEALGRNQEIEIRILGDFWRKPTFVHQRSPNRTRTRQGETTNLFPDIAKHSDLLLFWGCDPEVTPLGVVSHLPSRLCYWLTDLGIKSVYICPDLNYGAAVHADKWIPILPNTDVALQLAIAYIFVSALVIFNAEPDSFRDFFEALYWATVLLTTVGFGDITPVTVIGRGVAMCSSIFGIAIVALPSAIITAGYMRQIGLQSKEEAAVEQLSAGNGGKADV